MIFFSGLKQNRLKHQTSQEYNNLVKQEQGGNDSCRTLLEDQDYSDRNSFRGNSGMKRISHTFLFCKCIFVKFKLQFYNAICNVVAI